MRPERNVTEVECDGVVDARSADKSRLFARIKDIGLSRKERFSNIGRDLKEGRAFLYVEVPDGFSAYSVDVELTEHSQRNGGLPRQTTSKRYLDGGYQPKQFSIPGVIALRLRTYDAVMLIESGVRFVEFFDAVRVQSSGVQRGFIDYPRRSIPHPSEGYMAYQLGWALEKSDWIGGDQPSANGLFVPHLLKVELNDAFIEFEVDDDDSGVLENNPADNSVVTVATDQQTVYLKDSSSRSTPQGSVVGNEGDGHKFFVSNTINVFNYEKNFNIGKVEISLESNCEPDKSDVAENSTVSGCDEQKCVDFSDQSKWTEWMKALYKVSESLWTEDMRRCQEFPTREKVMGAISNFQPRRGSNRHPRLTTKQLKYAATMIRPEWAVRSEKPHVKQNASGFLSSKFKRLVSANAELRRDYGDDLSSVSVERIKRLLIIAGEGEWSGELAQVVGPVLLRGNGVRGRKKKSK